MNLITAVFYHCLSKEKGLKNSGLNSNYLNPGLCNAGAELYQLSYQANWKQVVVWVDYLTIIIPRAQMGFESIAREAEG